MPDITEVLRSLWGVWRLLLLDRRGIQAFDGTRATGLRSFWVALLLLPILALGTTVLVASGIESAALAVVEALAGITVAWLLPLLVMYGVVKWYGRGERYWLLLTALNWSQVPQELLGLLRIGLLVAAVSLIGGPDAVPDRTSTTFLVAALMANLERVIYYAAIFYEGFIAWNALESGLALPIAVTLLDAVITEGISYGIDQFLPTLTT